MDMYAVWLTCRMGGATVKTSALLERFGSPEGIYHAGPQELAEAAKLSKQELEQLGRHELDDVRRLMERCASLGIEAVHPWEDAYPGQLTQISNRPFTLFYRGKLETVQNRLCVAVVGTRSCTRYGASVAEKLAGDLAACGVTVVSGMADGIDSCANLGALKADGKTVAVLGNGVDRAYPAHNGYLMEQIIESGGLVASEYPPGSAISKGNFPARNRIISGLSQGVVVVEADHRKLDAMSVTQAHQGVIAVAAAKAYAAVEDILAAAADKGEKPLIVICDELSDPHNLGAVIRTAECAGAHGVIIPKRRSAGLTAVVAKTSAGAVSYLPVARVANIPALLEDLKKQGLWVFGTAADGTTALYDADLKGPAAIVIGSEGDGMSRLTAEKCDFLVSIPMKGHISSLNASAAAAILLYEAVRQRMQ